MTPWNAAYQAPLSMGVSRQEYWSGLPLPSPPAILGTPQLVDTSLQYLFHMKDVSVSSLLVIKTPVVGFRVISRFLTHSIHKDSVFQIRSHSEVPGGHVSLGDTIQHTLGNPV